MSKPEAHCYTRCGVRTAIGIAVHLGWLEREFAREPSPRSTVAALTNSP